ncbi:MAG: phage holin family protein [Rariglobus sp.]
MDDRPHASPGFIASLAGLGDNLIGTLQERLELIAVELQEEKYRLVQLIIWISAVVFAGCMTMTFATITVVYLFWDSARIAVLAGFTGLYGIALFFVVRALRRVFTHQPKPFEATIESLTEDRACIRK